MIEPFVARLSTLDIAKVEKVFPRLRESVERLSQIQNHVYKNRALASVSLIHRSLLVYWPKDKKGVFSNEQLEFLGDSFLNYTIGAELMARRPTFEEGLLSKLRSYLVGTDVLARKSQELKLSECLIAARADIKETSQNVLADLFEAVTAGLLLDGGEKVARDWIISLYSEELKDLEKFLWTFDIKTRLQQLTQVLTGQVPTYRVLGTSGTHHETHFIVGCFIGFQEVGRGAAQNKREASKLAAKAAYTKFEAGEITNDMIINYCEKSTRDE